MAFLARQQGDIVSCIGVGLDYNEALLAEIATQGGGRFYHIMNANQIPAYLAGELGEVASLAARDVKIHVTVPDGATLIPLSNAFPVQQFGSQAVGSVGDIPCDSELEIPLRLPLIAQTANTKVSIEGMLAFRSPAGHELECEINRVTVRFVEPQYLSDVEGALGDVGTDRDRLLGLALGRGPLEQLEYLSGVIQNLRRRLVQVSARMGR